MKLIHQKNEYDCGVAVVAMLSRHSYNTVSPQDVRPWARGSLYVSEVVDLLSSMTAASWFSVNIEPNYMLCEHAQPRVNCAMLIRREKRPGAPGHWIAYDGRSKKVLDPELPEAVRFDDYPRQDWILARRIERDESTPISRARARSVAS